MPQLEERTLGGLHDYLMSTVIPTVCGGARTKAADLGCGSGAFVERLVNYGCDTVGVDYVPPANETEESTRHQDYGASAPFVSLDFNRADAVDVLGRASFDLVTAIEVIEHLENPIAFLRMVSGLLKPTGVAVLTTPNVDSIPARLKFLAKGTVRMMDDRCDPSHISPIFLDLLRRHYLPRAELFLAEHRLFPEMGWKYLPQPVVLAYRAVAAVLPGGPEKYGDINVYVLRRVRNA